jgi:hypothetical protein
LQLLSTKYVREKAKLLKMERFEIAIVIPKSMASAWNEDVAGGEFRQTLSPFTQ